MNSKEFTNDVADILLDGILNMSEVEVNQAFDILGLSPEKECNELQNIYENAVLQNKKQKLKNARKELDQINQRVIAPSLPEISSIKDILIGLMTSGKMPADLTVAFRDGKEVSDEEALGMYGDLIELGVIEDGKESNIN